MSYMRKWTAAALVCTMVLQTMAPTVMAAPESLDETLYTDEILDEDAIWEEDWEPASASDMASDSDADFGMDSELASGSNMLLPAAMYASGREISVSTHEELVDAVKNASDGTVINLENDIDAVSSASLRVTSDITVNGNGHTLDGNGEYGFFVIRSGGFLTLENITVANAAQRSKRASVIYTYGSKAGDGAALTNCTIINNKSSSAAIYISSGREFSMVNCTVVDNPGKALRLSDTNAQLANNIIVGSSTDVDGSAVQDKGYNLIGRASNASLFDSGTSVVDPELASYESWMTDASDYDPEEMGLPLLKTADSPALDKIPEGNTWMPETDQRGMDRPKNELGDIGAYELNEYSHVTELELGTPVQENGTVTVSYAIGGEEGDNFNYGVIWSVTGADGTELPDNILVKGTGESEDQGSQGEHTLDIISAEAIPVRIRAVSLTDQEIMAEAELTVEGNPARLASERIAELPERITSALEAQVAGIRELVDALMEQYGLSDADISNYAKLTAAEARIQQLKDQQGNIQDMDQLLEAISEAEAGDTLYLGADITPESGSTSGWLINISKNITIDGQGHVLDGNGKYSFFHVTSGSTLKLQNMTVQNAFSSSSSVDGCVAYVENGSLELENCSIVKNRHTHKNGYIICVERGYGFSMVNCTMMENSYANSDRAAVYLGRSSTGRIANSILAGNSSGSTKENYDIYLSSSGTSIRDEGYNRISAVDNLGKSSGFSSDTTEIDTRYNSWDSWMEIGGDGVGRLLFTADNPFIDQIPAGNPWLPETDQLGTSRPQNAKGDIGAYEFEFAPMTVFEVQGEHQLDAASGQPVTLSWRIGGEEDGVYDYTVRWDGAYASGYPLDSEITVQGLDTEAEGSVNGMIWEGGRTVTMWSPKDCTVILTATAEADPSLTDSIRIALKGNPAAYVESLITAIPDSDKLQLTDRSLVEQIRRQVDSLLAKYRLTAGDISNYEILTAAEEAISRLETGLPAVDTAGALIDAIYGVEDQGTIYVTGDISLDAMSSASLKYSEDKSFTIEGNGHTIDFNHKSGFMYIGADQIVIRDLTFKNAKMSDHDGSVLSLRDGTTARVENCSFIGNRSAMKGGAVDVNSNSKAEFYNCTFEGNESGLYGGAIYKSGSGDLSLVNCVFYGNRSWQYGGAFYSNSGSSSRLDILNSTIVGNQADESGSGIYIGSGGTSNLANSIVVGNTNSFGETNDVYMASAAADIDGGWNLIGETNGDNRFAGTTTRVDKSLGDYESWLESSENEAPYLLKLKSNASNPAIDKIEAGNMYLPSEDREGNARPFNGKGDIGAYENTSGVVTVDAISGATINEKTFDSVTVNSGESFTVKSAVRADRINVDLSSDWSVSMEDGSPVPDSVVILGMEEPAETELADDEMSQMEVWKLSVVTLKDQVLKFKMAASANPEMYAELTAAVKGGNFDLNNRELADELAAGISGISYRMKQRDVQSEADMEQYIRRAVYEKYDDEFPLTVTKLSYTPAAAGSLTQMAGTEGRFEFTVTLAGGEGELAYAVTTAPLALVIEPESYMTDENSENVLKLELILRQIQEDLAAVKGTARMTQKRAESAVKAILDKRIPEQVSCTVQNEAYQASSQEQEGFYQLELLLSAGSGSSYAQLESGVLQILLPKLPASSGRGSGGSGSGGSSSGGSGSAGSSAGIVSGERTGSSGDTSSGHWVSEETPGTSEGGVSAAHWRLQHEDGSFAAGYVDTDETGAVHEHMKWEEVNHTWYAFGADGYAASGWVQDPDLGGTFYIDINTGMKTGWTQIDGVWYYFNPVSDGKRGALVTDTWIDGWYVDQNGVWNGEARKNL